MGGHLVEADDVRVEYTVFWVLIARVAVDTQGRVRVALGMRGLRRTHRAIDTRDGKGRVYPIRSKFIHEQNSGPRCSGIV